MACVLGWGTGSTAAWMVRCLGEQVRDGGMKIKRRAQPRPALPIWPAKLAIDVISLDEAKWLDVTIDGADEYDANLNLIKRGGWCLVARKDHRDRQ